MDLPVQKTMTGEWGRRTAMIFTAAFHMESCPGCILSLIDRDRDLYGRRAPIQPVDYCPSPPDGR